MGYWNVYPNMYVVLVANPGRCRKTVAINAALSLFEDIPSVRVSADLITREALIQSIKRSEDIVSLNSGKMYLHSSVTVISKELSVFLGHGNFDFLSLLTDLYDAPNNWEYRTKNSGVDTCTGVWLNLLGASTPAWLSGSVPVDAIGGGFTSRVIFVVEENVRKKNPFPILGPRELKLKEELRNDLEEIALMSGEFILTEDATEFFAHWYMNDLVKSDDKRFAGYYERKHIHVLKVSTILATCEQSDYVIERKHIKFALHLLDNMEKKMLAAFGAVGRSPVAQDIAGVLEAVKKAKFISKGDIARCAWLDVQPEKFDKILIMLEEMGAIERSLKEGKVFYRFVSDIMGG